MNMDEIFSQENWELKYGGPLYSQFSQHIENSILSGLLKEGTPLPTEREISQMSGLSRVTVRKAFQSLVKNGLVKQKQGSGTFIAPQVNNKHSLSLITSFTENMRQKGLQSNSLWLDKGIFEPTPNEKNVLNLSAKDKVSRMVRLRIADNTPLAIEKTSIPTDILPQPEKVGSSLYEHFSETNTSPCRITQRISARIVDTKEAMLLDIPDDSACLDIERIAYLESDRAIELTQSIFRADKYDFISEVQIPTEYDKE